MADNMEYLGNEYQEAQADEYDLSQYIDSKIYSSELDKFKNIDQLAKGYLDQAKNYNNIRAAYDGKTKNLNDEQRLTLAKEFSHTVYGIPDSPEGYEISTKLEIENEIDRHTYETSLNAAAHYLGIPKANAENFREVFEGYADYIVDQLSTVNEKQLDKNIKECQKEFGADLSKMINIIDNFFDKSLKNSPLANDVPELKHALLDSGALANKAVLKLIYNFASMFNESPISKIPGQSYTSMPSRSNPYPGRASVMDRSHLNNKLR